MAVKDKLVKWFIDNFIIPSTEIIDKPGFIVTKFSEKNRQVFLREIIYPEEIFSNIEKTIVKKFGLKGDKALYSAGKIFGYRYADISFFPSILNSNEKNISDFLYLFVKYAESMWSKEITYEHNLKDGIFELNMDNYIICRKNGLGHVLTEGAVVGFWCFMNNSKNIEGVQTKCQGRGNKLCHLVCAPKDILKQRKIKYFTVDNFSVPKLGKEHDILNKIRDTTSNNLSFRNLIDSKIVDYSKGVINFKGNRHFLCEASLFYILEKELIKIKGSDRILFKTSFDFGKKLSSSIEDDNKIKFIMNYMSSMGWGDIKIIKRKNKFFVISDYFPWTIFYKDISFIIFRGLISGLLSGCSNRNVKLNKIRKDLRDGYFKLIVSE